MFRSVLTFAAVALMASVTFATSITQPATDFKGTDALSGKEIALSDFKGKTVVLEWNNFGCPFVQKFYGSGTMQKLQAEAVKDGVVWITINSSAEGKEGYFKDDAEAKAAFTKQKGNASHYLRDADGTIGHAYGAKTTPHMYVIDAQGMLVYQGAIDSKPTPDAADIKGATNYVTAALESLKKGAPIKESSTQAYGCFVKYK